MGELTQQAPIVPKKKRDRPFLGRAVKDGKIRYLSAKQVLQFDSRHDGCPRKWANEYVFGRKLPRPEYLDEGVSAAEITEHYLTTGEMVLPPLLLPAARFFPTPRNESGELDLVCEQPLGDIAATVRLRDEILRRPSAPNLAAAEAELLRLAGVVALGIPFDGAADWVHLRGTYKDKDGVLRREAPGHVVVGVGDLKTTSRINTHVTPRATIQGWAQTDAEVVSDPQMLAYGKHRLRLHAGTTHARLEKVYAQKKPYDAAIRGGLVSRQQVDDGWGEIERRLISEMVQVAGASRIEDVPPSLRSCEAYTHVIPCGFPGCGQGCAPGKVKGGAETCPHCKGKGKTEKGCGYRGTPSCPISESVQEQVPLISLRLGSRPVQGEQGMSLFDRLAVAPQPPTAPPQAPIASPPLPPPALADASYEQRVALERAAIEAELRGETPPVAPVALTPLIPPAPPVPQAPVAPPQPPVPPSPPLVFAPPAPPSLAPSAPSVLPPVPPTAAPVAPLGELIDVVLCAAGEEYAVPQGGSEPRRMRFHGPSLGKFKFVDEQGSWVDLEAADRVFRLSSRTAPATTISCGAPGCGIGCRPGMIRTEQNSFYECPACKGRGMAGLDPLAVKPPDAPRIPWLDQQAPLSDEAIAEIENPELRALALEHKRKCEEREQMQAASDPSKASRGGNCLGSGRVVIFAEQPSVVNGKVVCPVCGAERTIPKEIRKAKQTEMPFPGHRRPKEESSAPSAPPVPPSTPPTPAVQLPNPPLVSASPAPVPPVPPRPPEMLLAAPPPVPPPSLLSCSTCRKSHAELPCPEIASQVAAAVSRGEVILDADESALVAALLRDRFGSLPRGVLGDPILRFFAKFGFAA